MTILLHKPYLVKVTTKGGGESKNTQKFDHVVYGRSLRIFDYFKIDSGTHFLDRVPRVAIKQSLKVTSFFEYNTSPSTWFMDVPNGLY